MTIEIAFENAAEFTAGLVRQGVTFKAMQLGDKVVFTMTGGY